MPRIWLGLFVARWVKIAELRSAVQAEARTYRGFA
jgi:hypothetical protein